MAKAKQTDLAEEEPKQETPQQEKNVITNWSALTAFQGTHEEISVIKKSICKDLIHAEFLYFLNYCAEVKLHPLLKQVWVYKKKDWTDRNNVVHRGELVMFTGRDGHLTNAERHPDYMGYKSAAVYQNDDFEIDYNDWNDPVKHKVKGFDRGPLLGAYAICFRKNCPPAVSVLRLPDFSKRKPAKNAEQEQRQIEESEKKGKQSAWDTNEMDMIIVRAEDKVFSKQFPISGMQSQYDWKRNDDGTVSPINTNEQVFTEDEELLHLEAMEDLFGVWEDSKNKDKNFMKTQIIKENEEGKMTADRIQYWKDALTAPKEKYQPEE